MKALYVFLILGILITAALVILKLLNIIAWAWIWIFCPIPVSLILWGLLILVVNILYRHFL